MSGTVSIGGKHVNKWVVYGGVGAVVIGGVLYFKNKGSSSSSSSSGTAQTGTDPVTGLPYSMDSQVDPATGMSYLAEAQQYGSVSAAEASVGAGYGGVSGGGYGYSGVGYGGLPTYDTGSAAGTATGVSYPDNASWAQAVEAGLTNLGYSSTDVAAAIGRYLGKLSLTAAQASMVQAGVAEYGPPPVGTFQIITQSSAPGPTGSGTSGLITVPDLAGQSAGQAHNALTALGLVPTAPPSQKANMKVWYTNPRAGSMVSKGTHVTIDTQGYV